MNISLPEGLHVFERGWLSSNNILLVSGGTNALIDSSYCTHSEQTVALLRSVLKDAPLDTLANTHLHSDHCGGNAALQATYPGLQTWIPPGHAGAVEHWDDNALTYRATGQECPRFTFNGLLLPGNALSVGEQEWEIHAAAGHDPHSVILFEPRLGVLISADALWESGFGVVFPELEGEHAFDDVAATFDLIESLKPKLIIPGHGRPFSDLQKALGTARRRLGYFATQPDKHHQYAAKVLIKFKLLELQTCSMQSLLQWASQTPYLERMRAEQYAPMQMPELVLRLVEDLARSGAAVREGEQIMNGK